MFDVYQTIVDMVDNRIAKVRQDEWLRWVLSMTYASERWENL